MGECERKRQNMWTYGQTHSSISSDFFFSLQQHTGLILKSPIVQIPVPTKFSKARLELVVAVTDL